MKIAFVSTRNAVRSIVAEAVARKISRLALLSPDIYSAGVEPADRVPEEVKELLKEKGYPVEKLQPKGLSSIPYESIDLLITLSPEARDLCPYSEKHMRREHWMLEEVKALRREELLKLLEQLEGLMKGLFKIS
ncbi:MAG: low molecular weight phosphatase family protein [Aquificaceae bacterium]|nr:low molecular weight phosphatase family protein [Aquificaceae bacterium]MCS7196917.1 low molecular weight phosphatase family protein [Aquificaceae bacterium]MCX7989360.1 low molecular weight phosphatase family protein [Aquificaceae bacterium]MDW8032920.1 low molecular weight phosphatase family protein [Aquificaceae bacterium]MDW8295019.1 low molecular weight phosphatase family protein [Aquificaceae bacterium]